MIRQHTSVRIPKVFVSPGLYLTGAQVFQTLFFDRSYDVSPGIGIFGKRIPAEPPGDERIRDDIFGYGSVFYI